MGLFDSLRDAPIRFFMLRGSLQALNRIADQQEIQSLLLKRLVDQLAPEPPADPTESELRTTGPSFSRDAEQAALQDWVVDFQEKVGRPPTEAEIEAWFDEHYPTPLQTP